MTAAVSEDGAAGGAAHEVEILVNKHPVRVPSRTTGAFILSEAGAPSDDQLFRVEGDKEIPVGDGEIEVHAGERFVATPPIEPGLMHPVLRAAVDEAAAYFGQDLVTLTELPDGSVRVTISGQDIGQGWKPDVVSITTTLLLTYPAPPPYPFYLPAGLRKADGGTIPNMSPTVIDGVPVTQLSVRPLGGRAVGSLPALIHGVVSWLRSR